MSATLTSAKFARTVTALASQFVAGHEVGIEWLFMVSESADVRAWAPRKGHLVLQLIDADECVQRTVTVCPGEYRQFEVVSGDRHVIGETRGAEAAMSLALDYLVAPLRAAVQHEHDAVSV